jgi:hypothetical protein
MNIQPDNATTNISDDQELAKVLAGVNPNETVDYEQTAPAPAVAEPVADPAPAAPLVTTPVPSRDDLESVKMEAVQELRPLIDKLNLPAEEKFDTYLLLIRCTDDKELVSPAHECAKQIEDESRRAMALLDIIKEIDYLSNKQSTPAPAVQTLDQLGSAPTLSMPSAL